jgi:hypothetical protein
MINPFNRYFGLLHLSIAIALTTGCGTNDVVDGVEADQGTRTLETREASSREDGWASSELSPASAAAARGGLFTQPTPWNKEVSGLAKSDESDAILDWLIDHGGFGTPRLRIEFSLKLLWATGSTPFRHFTPTDDFFSPDCDAVPFPVPAGGALEDHDDYACTSGGDCHLLVVHQPTQTLYEMWRANLSGGKFRGGCAAVWDLHSVYHGKGRGEQCTSADAAGLPIAGLLFTADEVASGSIDHAIRFVLPNDRIRRGVYVHPATHASSVLTGGRHAPPYGVRLRLRADYPLASLPSSGARTIARALQHYGMILSDGGSTPITAANDRFTNHKWNEVGVEPGSLADLDLSDMEVVDLGVPIEVTGDCQRN